MPTDLQKEDELRKEMSLLEDIRRHMNHDNSEEALFLIDRRLEQIKLMLED